MIKTHNPPIHVPYTDQYGAVICLTCTALEAHVIAGVLVNMYWGEGSCPGTLDLSPHLEEESIYE